MVTQRLTNVTGTATLTRVLLIALCLGLAGCSSDSNTDDIASDDSTDPTVTAEDLNGRSFSGSDASPITMVEGSAMALAFTDTQVSGSGGCNQLSTTYTIDDGVLKAEAPAMTMMACMETGLMDQDTWLSELLASSPTVTLSGPELTLDDGTNRLTLTEAADAPLAGTTWNLVDSGADMDSAVSSEDAVPSITLDATATQLTINTGCNTGSGEVTVAPSADATEGTLTVGPLMLTKKACIPENGAVESAMLQVLDGEVAFAITGNSLTLTKGEDALGFVASGLGASTTQ